MWDLGELHCSAMVLADADVLITFSLSCWGITQGPGTGKILSEMVLEGKAKSADVSKLAP